MIILYIRRVVGTEEGTDGQSIGKKNMLKIHKNLTAKAQRKVKDRGNKASTRPFPGNQAHMPSLSTFSSFQFF